MMHRRDLLHELGVGNDGKILALQPPGTHHEAVCGPANHAIQDLGSHRSPVGDEDRRARRVTGLSSVYHDPSSSSVPFSVRTVSSSAFVISVRSSQTLGTSKNRCSIDSDNSF